MKKETLLMVAVLLLGSLAGCRSLNHDPEPLPLVDDRYELFSEQNSDVSLKSFDYEASQEIRIEDGTLVDVAEFFRTKTGKTLITNAPDVKISGLFCGSPKQIAKEIGTAYNLIYAEFGNVLYLVQGDQAKNLNISVALTCDLSIEDLRGLFPSLFFVRRDCMIVANGDFLEVCRLQDYLSILNQVKEQNYVVTVVEVETSRQSAFELQAEIASKGVDLIRPDVTLYDVFSAVVRATGDILSADNYHERQLVVTSGQETVYSRSTEKKIEQRSISDAGTSTVSGYENVNAGVILTMTVDSYDSEFVRLAYNVELSSFVGTSLDKTSVKAQSEKVLMTPSKVYYIASSEDRINDKSMALFGFGRKSDVVVSSIFVKIDKIGK